ncbi:bacteriohemerythrin [Brachyspira pilosicoli]|uniref:bacteriohemerythrin n=1 Tax=Brachyspira pilosicoli TaxID=52584 RepID=UPI0024925480|nr:bacteriohemerythrin [Brachyspira pilosicoli]
MTIVNDEKYIVWKDTFNTGYKRIDEQHEKFVGMLNRLYDINADKDLNNPKIRQEFNSVLKDTIDYMVYHFKTEEDIMKAINYKNIVKHSSKHRDFSNKILGEVKTYTANNYIVGLITYLRNWLFNHILIEDKAFVYELKAILKKTDN